MIEFFIALKFHRELNDFLPRSKNKRYRVKVAGHQTLKDIFESEGVPHPEVDIILVNGKSSRFNRNPRPGSFIELYPSGIFYQAQVRHLLPSPMKRPKFFLDEHLGKLTRSLRMCGIDAKLFKGKSDKELVQIALLDKRIILTRDIGLLKRSAVRRGYWVRNEDPDRQLEEIIDHFSLKEHIRPFYRCMQCNGIIRKTGKKNVYDLLPAKTRLYFEEYFRCRSCGKIYRKGSHYEKMKSRLAALLK